MSTRRSGEDRLVRAYVVTGGRYTASRNHFDFVALISLSSSAAHLSRTDLNPEGVAILRSLAVGGARSVAELSAQQHLPVSVVRVLLADLMQAGHITTRRFDNTPTHDRNLLEAVLAGLRKL